MRLSLKRLQPLRERGDTITEVLIAIAVVSLILGGAYVTANRSLQNTRDAEERSNALKVTEGQVEQIKYLATANPTILFGGTAVPALGPFCIAGGLAVSSPDALPNAQCRVDSAGAPTTQEPAYRISIRKTGNLFTVITSWTKVGGKMQNNVELKYRVYQ